MLYVVVLFFSEQNRNEQAVNGLFIGYYVCMYS